MQKIMQSDYEREKYCVEAQNIQSIVVEIASLPVEINLIEGNNINILFPKTRSTDSISTSIHNKKYEFHHEIQKFSFPFSGFQHFHQKVLIGLPRKFHGNFFIEVSNGTVLVNGMPEVADTKFITTNAAITLHCLKCHSAFVQSKNGAITVKNIASNSTSLKTCNASISGSIKGDIRDYAIESHTTIGSNTVANNPQQGQPFELKIMNRNGSIDLKFVR